VQNFVSFAASVAELARGEKSRTHSVTHPAYLMPREPKLSLLEII